MADNIWRDDWTSLGEQPWQAGTRTSRVGRGEILAATLHELPPRGRGGPLHFHHGNEEMLVVLRGRPTLRTPQGERTLEEGEVVVFRRGPDDAHKCSNETDEPVRYLMISNNASPDAVEYPEEGLLSVMAYTSDQFGKPLWDMRSVKPPVRDPDA
ncbi:MAG TPA: cupin domain-containing protein [Caulobacteraceae bacterium]|nr:cupin domain-containing protein [Caulobacteraceae bacterium]